MSKNETIFAQIETFFAKIYRNIFADKKIIRIFALFKISVAMDTFVSQSITSARTASFLREVRLSVCVNLFNLT